MSTNVGERLIFEAEWYDKVASIVRKFYLYYFPADNTVELVRRVISGIGLGIGEREHPSLTSMPFQFDLKNRKTFLRRTKCEGVEAKDLYIGGMVTIFSRAIKITDTADNATRNKLATSMQKTLGIIKPDAMAKMGHILALICNHEFHISNIKMVSMSSDDVNDFYKSKTDQELKSLRKYMTSGPVLALELLGENGIERWAQLVGPTDSLRARDEAPTSLRACYGKDSLNNALHASDDHENADKELEFFFPDSKSKRKAPKNTATLKNCTCCVIKPHAIHSRLAGRIIEDIQKAGYDVTAIQQFVVDPVNVEEFLEVYKGVLPEYSAMVAELQSGPCIALEITHADRSLEVPVEFRKFCGPMDPDIARQVRPETLRAKYGKTKVQNAVHCSDLPEDGLLEVEYFFKILAEE